MVLYWTMPTDTNPIFNLDTIVIVGPGLLGGSVALGLKAAGHTGKVIGVARSQSTLDIAIQEVDGVFSWWGRRAKTYLLGSKA